MTIQEAKAKGLTFSSMGSVKKAIHDKRVAANMTAIPVSVIDIKEQTVNGKTRGVPVFKCGNTQVESSIEGLNADNLQENMFITTEAREFTDDKGNVIKYIQPVLTSAPNAAF